MNIVTDFKFSLDRKLVLKAIDCYEDSEAYEEVCEAFEMLGKDIKDMLSPKAMFEFMERPEKYIFEDVKFCSHVVFCLLTLGEKVTEATESYFNGGLYLEGMLLDAMTDIILGEYSIQLYERVCREAERRGLGLTCKLSAGNADFHISNQKYILDRLQGREVLGIDITEGFMLRPVKSVSFIFGADKGLDIPISDHECSRCTSTVCRMRKEPYVGKVTSPTVNITVLAGDKKIRIKASKGRSLLNNLIDNEIDIPSPCAGNGTCGKCKIKVLEGKVDRQKNNEKLGDRLLKEGWVLACSTFAEEDCIISAGGESEDYSILDTFEEGDREVKSIIKHIKIGLDSRKLKGKSLTGFINETANKDYSYSLRALKGLGAVINSYGSDEETTILSNEQDINLIVYKNTVLDVCRTVSVKKYGIAIDIGTTTIALALVDLVSGKTIKRHSLLNSQRQFGADVISRIQKSNEGGLKVLNQCIKRDIIGGIENLCSSAGVRPGEVYHMAAAGNTTMLYLLLGIPCESLALFPFNTITIDMLEYSFEDIFQEKLLYCSVTILPGVSAYVGADIVSGMLQCNFHRLEKTSILIDVGTNGEMAMGNKDRILCLATAAGPAFEGANISCGIGSVRGAICSVTMENGKVNYTTIGGDNPIGICGSAVIDMTAECLKNSIIDETGRFDGELYEKQYIRLTDNIVFNQKDIREVQLAKSAIRSGLEILLQEFGSKYEEIDTVFLAGGFGNHMNIDNAAVIGLIPEELKGKVKVIGNSSLGGAAKYLTDESSREALDYILDKARYIDISSNKNFNDLFINNMLF